MKSHLSLLTLALSMVAACTPGADKPCENICANLETCDLFPSPLGEDVSVCQTRCKRSEREGDGGVSAYEAIAMCNGAEEGKEPIRIDAGNACSKECQTLAACLDTAPGLGQPALGGRGDLRVTFAQWLTMDAGVQARDDAGMDDGAVHDAVRDFDLMCKSSPTISGAVEMPYACIEGDEIELRVEDRNGALHSTSYLSCNAFLSTTHELEELPAGGATLRLKLSRPGAVSTSCASATETDDEKDGGTDASDASMPDEPAPASVVAPRWSCCDLATFRNVHIASGEVTSLTLNLATTTCDLTPCEVTSVACGNGIDDDCNNVFDCADPTCSSQPACVRALGTGGPVTPTTDAGSPNP